MNYFAPRTCTEIPEGDSFDDRPPSLPLEQFSENNSYVLLGSPGAGKTETFKKESEQEEGLYVTAREFINIPDRPEWHGTTLFIDGLDEMRAGAYDQRTPFDQIRGKLQNLGCPRFRLSCREADWFGANDRNHLKNVSPDQKLKVLRLDPLSNEDILKILYRNHNIKDPEQFIASAQKKEIYALLANPQSLKMLASAVADRNWPETRMETFDFACQKLICEHNQEHELAERYSSDIHRLLNEAGRLCAIQLLTGNAGYSLTHNETSHEYIHLRKIHAEDQEVFHQVLSTKLFKSPIETYVSPIHRQIAEFLGGRYLAKLIQEGLPVRRILALMTGYDGGIASELRGLSAWLAAHSPESRKEIIERDPLGVILYGDIRSFSVSERRQVLTRIACETKKNPWYIKVIGLGSYLEYFVTPDMQKYLQDVLTDPARDDAQQSFVRFLLETLRRGSSIPELSDVLIGIVRDGSRWPAIRNHALRAFIQQGKKGQKKTTELAKLLEDVNSGLVSDPDDELLGILLKELYPDFLSPSDTWEYFRTPKNPELVIGGYTSFWINLAEHSTTTQLDALIGEFVKRFDQFLEEYKANEKQFWLFPQVRLIMWPKFLETKGGKISPDELFNWLWTASDPELLDSYEEKKKINHWLSKNPDIKKTVFETGIKHGIAPWDILFRLFNPHCAGITHPPDFGLWCLEEAITATDKRHAEFFLRIVVTSIRNHSYDEGLSLEIVEKKLASFPILKQKLRDLLIQYDSELGQLQSEEKTDDLQERTQKQLQARIDYIRSHEKALRENRCPPRLIHDLARVYFGEDVNFPGYGPEDRLHNLLGGDKNLVSIVLKAFRDSVVRSDVPNEAEIIQMRKNNEVHYLALPFLAGMEELSQNEPESGEIPIADKQMRQALAFYFNAPLPISFSGFLPSWYQELLSANPNMVSDILISSARSRILKSKETFSDLYELAFQNSQAKATKLMTLPLLETFPVRCTKQQLQGLNYLLRVALLHCDEEPFLKLVNRKLSYPSMNIAQHIYWLTVGLIVSPSSFIEKLEAYLTSRERRVKSLLEFIKEFPDELIKRLDVPALKLLIRLIGYSSPFAWLSPEEAVGLAAKYGLLEAADKPQASNSEGSGWVSPSTEAVNLVHRLIQQLASIQSPSATDALEKLLSNHELHSWKQYLTDALRRQKLVRREASFSHLNVNQVLQTLNNEKPSNAADLSALTIDTLTDLANNIRDGNTSDWRQYWDMDTNNKPAKPRIEDFCRDTLLSDLRIKLNPLGVDAQPEGRYADDKRSDIRIAYNAMCNVPIEIKKSSHPDLWSAIKTQLIAKYARDPETDGYGLYLVFWFGKELCQSPGSGTRPQSAMELKERLIDSLTTDEQRKISICIIDVAKP